MFSQTKLAKAVMVGTLMGTVLAFAAPPSPAQARTACVCNDDATGHYKCNGAQTACITGNEKCVLTCDE